MWERVAQWRHVNLKHFRVIPTTTMKPQDKRPNTRLVTQLPNAHEPYMNERKDGWLNWGNKSHLRPRWIIFVLGSKWSDENHTTLLDRFKWKWFTRNYRFYFRSFSLFLAAFYILQLSNRKQIFFVWETGHTMLSDGIGGRKKAKFLPVANGNKMLGSKWFSGDKNVVGWCRLVRGRMLNRLMNIISTLNPLEPEIDQTTKKHFFRASDERHCGSCLTFNRLWINLGGWLAFVGLSVTRKMKVDIECDLLTKIFN